MQLVMLCWQNLIFVHAVNWNWWLQGEKLIQILSFTCITDRMQYLSKGGDWEMGNVWEIGNGGNGQSHKDGWKAQCCAFISALAKDPHSKLIDKLKVTAKQWFLFHGMRGKEKKQANQQNHLRADPAHSRRMNCPGAGTMLWRTFRKSFSIILSPHQNHVVNNFYISTGSSFRYYFKFLKMQWDRLHYLHFTLKDSEGV